MTDAEISAELARAMGWPDADVRIDPISDRCLVAVNANWYKWRHFSYTDWTIAGPVLDWLMRVHDCELRYGRIGSKKKIFWIAAQFTVLGRADTFPLAIARAAIAVGRAS